MTDPLPLGGRDTREIDPGSQRHDDGLELHEPGDLGRDQGDRDEEQRGVTMHQPEVATHAVAEQRADGKGDREPEQGVGGRRRVQRAGAGDRLARGEQQGEHDRRGDVREHRDGQERASERTAGAELAQHAHHQLRGRHGRQGAERQRHRHGVAG